MKEKAKKRSSIWGNFLKMIGKAKLPYIFLCVVFALSIAAAQVELLLPEKIAAIAQVGEIVSSETANSLIKILLSAFVIGVIDYAMYIVVTYLTFVAKAQVNKGMQIAAVDKFFSLRLPDIERTDPREFVSRITTDTGYCADFFVDLFVREPSRLYFLVSAIIKLVLIGDVTLILGALAVIPITVLLCYISGRFTFSSQNMFQSVTAQLTARLAEKLNNISVIKAYSTEKSETESGDAVIGDMRKAGRKVAVAMHISITMANLLLALPLSVILYTGVSSLLAGRITTAEFVVYVNLAQLLRGHVTDHNTLWTYLKKAQGATKRLSEVYELEDEKGGRDRVGVDGDIAFEHVTFAYGQNTVLDDVSFVAEKGKKTALVGYSGSGKSTILHLLEQFYRPKVGTITVGGKNISEFEVNTYRAHFAYLPQNAPGFDGTIRQMLNYGVEKPYSDEELFKAINAVSLKETVDMLGGLDYVVGANATKLSGGQRQKLSVARLLLSGGEYILLDEATSALDPQSAMTIQETVDAYCQGKTQILVAHSLATVKNADKILVFDKGKIVGSGTHKELLENCPLYFELVNQTKEGM